MREVAHCDHIRMKSYAMAIFSALFMTGVVGAGQEWQTVTAIQLNDWLQQSRPLLVLDLRTAQLYRSGTIPGAMYAGSDPMGFLPDSRRGSIVLITDKAVTGQQLRQWLKRLREGGHHVFLLQGGIAAWQQAGFAVEQPVTQNIRPGTVPYVIPRGLCELNEPAQVFK